MKKRFALLSIILSTLINTAWASDWEELCKDGYGVMSKTSVSGEFNGCDYDKVYKLDNNLYFKCSGYSYSYSYSPDFYILKHVQYGTFKYIIDDNEYDGTAFSR